MRQTRIWTSEEISYLTQNYRKQSHTDIAIYLQRSVRSIGRMAERLGLRNLDTNSKPIPQPDGTYHIPLYSKTREMQFAIIDKEDVDKVTGYGWYALTNPKAPTYARSKVNNGYVFMHNLILPPKAGFKVDHKNRNGLDNRRNNLRLANNTQNAGNSGPRNLWRGRETSSKYKGVYRDKKNQMNPWCASFRKKRLGAFATEIDAAKAYDKAAREAYGEFAYLNFPDED